MRFVAAFALGIATLAASACRPSGTSSLDARRVEAGPAIPRGGNLVVSVRADPRSFNRLVASDTSTDLVSTLTQAKLVRINKATQEVEPSLAESWTRSADGLRYTIKLRPDVAFADGQPFTSADVVFTFQAVYDENTRSVLADALEAGGKQLRVAAIDAHTVEVAFAEPFAAGIRLLDNLPMLPRHKLEPALQAGTLAKAWNLSTPPSEMPGVGPFVLADYQPGQHLVFTRNPRYFGRGADGRPLPYLDRITVEIVPDQNAELLRLEAGQIDMMTSEVGLQAYAPLKRAADEGRIRLIDLGVGYTANSLWFNLKPGAFGRDPRAAWLQHDGLRRAISLAVDRKTFADTVYFGAGVPVYGPETEANRKWHWAGLPRTPHDPRAAQQALSAIGLIDRNGDGTLEDSRGQPVRFMLLTQKGRPDLERGASVIRDELRKIGVLVDVVALEFSAVVERIMSARYEAAYFSPSTTDTDPALNLDFWFSSGSLHIWNMSQQTPATEWERRIDELMTRQVASLDEAERKRLFDRVQEIFAEHLPVVHFVAPRIYVAASSRVTNLSPALSRPQLLWTPETVAVIK